jgi:hypothetical protein
MPKSPKRSSKTKARNRITITVAVIGVAAAAQPTVPKAQSAPALVMAQQSSSTGSQSPAVSGVGRDVIINYGAKENGQSPTGSQRGALDGDWKTGVFFSSGGNRRQFYLKFKILADGRILGSAQPIDPDTGKTIFSPYGFKDGKLSGNSFTVSFYEGAKGRDASGDYTVEIYETLYGQIADDAITLQYVFPDMAPVETTARRAGKPATSNGQ